jgi:hypothetical protein
MQMPVTQYPGPELYFLAVCLSGIRNNVRPDKLQKKDGITVDTVIPILNMFYLVFIDFKRPFIAAIFIFQQVNTVSKVCHRNFQDT